MDKNPYRSPNEMSGELSTEDTPFIRFVRWLAYSMLIAVSVFGILWIIAMVARYYDSLQSSAP